MDNALFLRAHAISSRFLGLFPFPGKVIVHQVRHAVDHLMQVLQLLFLHSLGVILLMHLVLQFY